MLKVGSGIPCCSFSFRLPTDWTVIEPVKTRAQIILEFSFSFVLFLIPHFPVLIIFFFFLSSSLFEEFDI